MAYPSTEKVSIFREIFYVADLAFFSKFTRLCEDFELVKDLGKGVFGVVLQCKHKFDNHYYAVKIIKMDENNVTVSQKEVEHAMRLLHPNVVRYHTSWLHNKGIKRYAFIQMEFCAEGSLRNAIETQAFTKSSCVKNNQVETAWKVIAEALKGLDYIHSQGIIHRDIKPENIFLVDGWTAKLGDFGLITDARAPHHTYGVGSQLYMAPEIMKHYDNKVDIYSLGLVVFEIFLSFSSADPKRHIGITYSFKSLRVFEPPYGENLEDSTLTTAKDLVLFMIENAPENRPTARELLDKHPFLQYKDVASFFSQNQKSAQMLAVRPVINNTDASQHVAAQFNAALRITQDRKKSLISEARKCGEQKKYTERLRVWRKILDLNMELSDDEKKEARSAAWSIDEFLSEEDYLNLSSEATVTHSELAIPVLDRLIQTEKNVEQIYLLLARRWNNDGQLINKGKGLGSWKKRNKLYVQKAREAYARFSPAHPERIKTILDYVCRLEKNERMQMEELQILKEEVEAARADLKRMNEQERKESELWLSAVKRHLENTPRKNKLKRKAKEEEEEGRLTEKLRLWKQIIELNVELSLDERDELREACRPLEKLKSAHWPVQENCDHSLLVVSTVELYVRQALTVYSGERLQVFSLLWENEEVLWKAGKLSSTVNERALRVVQLIKERLKKEGVFVDYAKRISLCAHFLRKMEDGREKLAELKKLADEVEDVWKTHPTRKNAVKLAQLSKVKTEMERLSKSF